MHPAFAFGKHIVEFFNVFIQQSDTATAGGGADFFRFDCAVDTESGTSFCVPVQSFQADPAFAKWIFFVIWIEMLARIGVGPGGVDLFFTDLDQPASERCFTAGLPVEIG